HHPRASSRRRPREARTARPAAAPARSGRGTPRGRRGGTGGAPPGCRRRGRGPGPTTCESCSGRRRESAQPARASTTRDRGGLCHWRNSCLEVDQNSHFLHVDVPSTPRFSWFVVRRAPLIDVERSGQNGGQVALPPGRRGAFLEYLARPAIGVAIDGDELSERVRLPDLLAQLVEQEPLQLEQLPVPAPVRPGRLELACPLLPLLPRDLDAADHVLLTGNSTVRAIAARSRRGCAPPARSRDSRVRMPRAREGT